MTTLSDIETGAKRYADAREKLSAIVRELKNALEAMTRDHLPDIKRAIERATLHETALLAMVEDAPDLFVKPRSVVFHGIKIGWQKGKGKIEWEDADRVVALIRKHLPEQAEVLILVKEAPSRDALAALSANDLKRLGIRVVDADDAAFVKPTDGEVEKMVNALIKGAVEAATS